MQAFHGRASRIEAVIAWIAATQYGAFSRQQALDAGFTPRMIAYRLRTGRWVATDFNVYRAASTPTSWSQMLMSVCLSGPAVASHRAAARLWGLPGFAEAPVEVTALRHRRRTPGSIVWHESWFLDERRDVTMIDGIRVTSATRTIVDLSTVATEEAIEIALDAACHRALTSRARVGEELERLGRRVGMGRIRLVLAQKSDEGATPESPLETRTAAILRRSDLPRATPQCKIYDGSTFIGRVDFAWPEHRLVLEVDGFNHHSDRHSFERDRARQNKLTAAGWRVLRITHRRLNAPDGVVAEIRQALCAA